MTQQAGKLDAVDANAFTAIAGFFVALFHSIFTPSETKQIVSSVEAFIETDLGELTVSVVEYIEVEMPGAASADKKAAALAKLKTDAAAAGKDLTGIAESTLNWFIETALQYILAKGIGGVASLAANDEPETKPAT